MLNAEDLKAALEASPAERVTEEYMASRIASTTFVKMGETMTHCTITLDNGYMVTGESACVKPENYRQDIGETYAEKDAIKKLWPLFGFLLAEKNFRALPADGLAEGGDEAAAAATDVTPKEGA